jgi:hypothetical protein
MTRVKLHMHVRPPAPGRLRLTCDGTRAETRFRLSAKRTSPFKSAEASVQLTTGSRGVRISGSNAGYTVFRGSAKSTAYPFHSPVFSLHFPSRASPCAITFQLDSTLQHTVRVSGFTKQYCLINGASIFQADFTDTVSTLHDIQHVE